MLCCVRLGGERHLGRAVKRHIGKRCITFDEAPGILAVRCRTKDKYVMNSVPSLSGCLGKLLLSISNYFVNLFRPHGSVVRRLAIFHGRWASALEEVGG